MLINSHISRDIERFEDTREKEEEDDEDKKLNADFVDRAHFGGFLTQSDVEFASGKSNTRKEWIEQMIAESKKRKLEKQTALEEAETETTELDKKWKEMHSNPRYSCWGDIHWKMKSSSEIHINKIEIWFSCDLFKSDN